MLVAGAQSHVFIPKLIHWTALATFAYISCATLRRKSTARSATRAVVPRRFRNFACTLREVEYIWLSQKSCSSFPSQTDLARLLLNSVCSLTNPTPLLHPYIVIPPFTIRRIHMAVLKIIPSRAVHVSRTSFPCARAGLGTHMDGLTASMNPAGQHQFIQNRTS
jgi:hypothetical protein